MATLILKGKLYLAPIKNAQRVLDWYWTLHIPRVQKTDIIQRHRNGYLGIGTIVIFSLLAQSNLRFRRILVICTQRASLLAWTWVLSNHLGKLWAPDTSAMVAWPFTDDLIRVAPNVRTQQIIHLDAYWHYLGEIWTWRSGGRDSTPLHGLSLTTINRIQKPWTWPEVRIKSTLRLPFINIYLLASSSESFWLHSLETP